MRIYHYTNIETLALVLKNKTIRFNRLDRVDDLEEGQTESSGIKTGPLWFILWFIMRAIEKVEA